MGVAYGGHAELGIKYKVVVHTQEFSLKRLSIVLPACKLSIVPPAAGWFTVGKRVDNSELALPRTNSNG